MSTRTESIKPESTAGAAAPVAEPFAAMAMYPLEPLREAWDHLYTRVARSVNGSPDGLRWDLDVHATWLDPQLVLGMTCGWPLVTQLIGRVRVLGTFAYELDGEVGHTYRSVIVAREGTPIRDRSATPAEDDDEDDGVRPTLAFNSLDSLSGYVSMLATLPQGAAGWHGSVIETGAHTASIDAVRDGGADVASIDALTWAYLARDSPERLSGLTVVDRGPVVPHLPLIANVSATDEMVDEWRAAFATAVRDPELAPTLDRLLIRGFVALDAGDYQLALEPLEALIRR